MAPEPGFSRSETLPLGDRISTRSSKGLISFEMNPSAVSRTLTGIALTVETWPISTASVTPMGESNTHTTDRSLCFTGCDHAGLREQTQCFRRMVLFIAPDPIINGPI
jgi:hypothetical protein